jgi:hypothetical protein
MVSDASHIGVLKLLFQLEDATAEPKILGEHVGTVIFELADAKRSYVV